jgi:hypothetical protein
VDGGILRAAQPGDGAATTARPSLRPKPARSARESRHASPIDAIPRKNANFKTRHCAAIISDRPNLVAAPKSRRERLRSIVVQLPQREFRLFRLIRSGFEPSGPRRGLF